MDKNSIRTDDERLERNRLVEYNRKQRAETVSYIYLIHYSFRIFLFRFNQLIYSNFLLIHIYL